MFEAGPFLGGVSFAKFSFSFDGFVEVRLLDISLYVVIWDSDMN